MTERVLPAPAALDLSKLIRAGDTVIWGQACAGPLALTGALGAQQPRVLAGQPCLTTINAAVEIDLTGQINTEVAAGRYVGAAGGSLDFARGASLSHNGVPITVLRSTAAGRSTIVADLSGPAAIPRSEAGWVVTEFGAVDLRGLTLSQRRERLLSVAHPDHRDALAAVPSGPGESRTAITTRSPSGRPVT